MKTISLLQYLTIFILLISCGSENQEKKQEKTAKENNLVELIVEFKSAFNDKFEVYYTVEPNEQIKGDYKLVCNTYGSDQMQRLVFQFPSGELPYKLRLDVGENPSANNITIKNVSVKYGDKLIDGDNGQFADYFNLYEGIKYNTDSFIYEFVPVNGKKDPFIFSNEYLDSRLLDLYK